jgi:hypothetical protein
MKKTVTCKKLPGRPFFICMHENITRLSAAVNRERRRLACMHAQALCMSDGSVQHVLHSDLNFYPNKAEVVQ